MDYNKDKTLRKQTRSVHCKTKISAPSLKSLLAFSVLVAFNTIGNQGPRRAQTLTCHRQPLSAEIAKRWKEYFEAFINIT